jgi:hypothetical protein
MGVETVTAAEARDYLELRHRLYGGWIDSEPGDIVTMKQDIEVIKAAVHSWSGAIRFVKVASSVVGAGGGLASLAVFVRAVVGG